MLPTWIDAENTSMAYVRQTSLLIITLAPRHTIVDLKNGQTQQHFHAYS